MAKNENIDFKLNFEVDESLKSVRTMQLEIKALKIQEMEFETARNQAIKSGDDIAAKSHQERINQIKAQRANLVGAREDAAAAEKMMDPGNLVAQYSKMAQGAVGSFAAVSGAMKAMGVENETITNITNSSAAALEVMIGLEKVHAFLIDGKSRAENAAAIKSGAIWVKNMAMKTADIAVTSAQAVATGAVTAAQWLLNIAMEANPIGLIILGVAGLIAGFVALYKATGSVTEALLWMVNPLGMLAGLLIKNALANDELTEAELREIQIKQQKIDAINSHINAIEKENLALDATVTSRDQILAVLKAQGKTDEEIEVKRREYNAAEIKRAQNEITIAQEKYNKIVLEGKNANETQIEFENRLKDAKIAITTKWNAWKDKDMAENNRKQVEDAKNKKKEDDKKADNLKKAQERWKKIVEDGTNARNKIIDGEYENELNNILKLAELNGDYKLANETKIKILEESARKEQEELDKNYSAAKKGLGNNKSELAKLEIEYNKASLNISTKLNLDKKEIDDKATEDKKNRIKDKDAQISEIVIADLEQRYDDEKDLKEKHKLFLLISEQNEAKEINEYKEKNAELQKTNLELYNKGLQTIQTKFNNERVENEKNTDKEIADEKEKIKNEIKNLKQKNLNDNIDELETAYSKELKIHQEYLAQKKISLEDYNSWVVAAEEDKNKKIEELRQKNFADEVTNTTEQMDNINNTIQNAIKTRIDNIDIEYNRDVDNLTKSLDAGLITQSQFDKKKELLEKQKNDKIRKEKEKAWKIQHAVDIANAVAKAAIAVSEVFASEPGELAIKTTAAGIAAAIAAANVAIISSQKMPKFARGGFVGGQSHINGGTIIEAEAGEFIVNKNAMKNIGFANIIQSINASTGGVPAINAGQILSPQMQMQNNIDADKIALIIIKAIQNIPVTVLESDITNSQKKVAKIINDSIIS